LSEFDLNIVPPPLADPVFLEIFLDSEVSGLAMKSLLNACLADSGDEQIGNVVTVTPPTRQQWFWHALIPRGRRSDNEQKRDYPLRSSTESIFANEQANFAF
jgi:hypothetical protein